MMNKIIKNNKKLKIFSVLAILVALLFALAACDFILDFIFGFMGGSDIPFDPKTRGDSITSTIFEAHLYEVPEEERNDVLPVDSFIPTINLTDEIKTSEYTSSEKVNIALRKLLEAVVDGKRPILSEDPENPIRRVWDAARAALNLYVHDSYDEYEAAHTIYDWVVYYVDYDHKLLDDYLTSPSSVNSNNPAFHLSGAFLSGLAVCDGISKAFSLLCAMQGIEVERVLGWYYNGDQYVGHAWNKVSVQVPGQTEKNWFFVDPTFASASLYEVKNGKKAYTEYLTHAYFLLSDAKSSEHLQDDSYTVSSNYKTATKKNPKSAATIYQGVNQGGGGKIYNNCDTEFDYYDQETNSNQDYAKPKVTLSGLSAYIRNYAVPGRIEGVEVKLDIAVFNKATADSYVQAAFSTIIGNSESRPVNRDNTFWFYCGGDDHTILMIVIVYNHKF